VILQRPPKDAFLGGQLRLRQPKIRPSRRPLMLSCWRLRPRRGPAIAWWSSAPVSARGAALARRVGAIDLVLIEIDAQLAGLARDKGIHRRRSRRV